MEPEKSELKMKSKNRGKAVYENLSGLPVPSAENLLLHRLALHMLVLVIDDDVARGVLVIVGVLGVAEEEVRLRWRESGDISRRAKVIWRV